MNTLTEEQVLDIVENIFFERPDQVALALQILKEEEDFARLKNIIQLLAGYMGWP